MNTKSWDTPKLIVLVRGKPEEGVLAACKYFSVIQGSGTDNGGCYIVGDCFTLCVNNASS
jgi:hypothetical protein